MIHPRPYQKAALDAIRQEFNSAGSTLLVMATGLGKTITFSEIAGEMAALGRILVLAHRGELIDQAARHLYEITGEQVAIEMADEHVSQYALRKPRIVVGTIQTQISGMKGKGRMTKFDPREFSLLIIDEAHHSAAKSYMKVIQYYRQNPDLKVLGVTATPDRADERALGEIFETVAYEYDIRDGIDEGWLVPITQSAVYVDDLDYSTVRTTAGDLNGADLAKILEFEETLHRMAAPTIEMAGDRKTLVFCATVAQAERFAEILNRHRAGCAEWVCGKTPKDERQYMIERYARRDFQYLVNVGVATEGFDDPGIEVVVLGRPTKSRSLYAQMIGRGTRTLPGTIDGLGTADERKERIESSGKPHIEVLDFVGNSGRHRLITAADILGGTYSDEVVERAKKNIQKGKTGDVISELDKAEAQIQALARKQREEAKRKGLLIRTKYSKAKINPFEVLDLCPCREKGWHKGRQPTEKQDALLKKWGVDTAGLSFTHASQIIDKLIKRRNADKCSYKQARLLQKFGYDPSEVTFKEASGIIDTLAKNGWRRTG